MKNIKNAFTMIELVFVIVVLGILSAVAIPKLSGTVEDANLATGMATVSSIRSSIASERQSNLVKGLTDYPALLDDATENTSDEELFDGNTTVDILQYPLYSGEDSGSWMKTSANGATTTYKYYIGSSKTVVFTYTKATGIFDCDHSTDNCKLILHH